MTVTVIVLAAGQGSRFRAEAGADRDKLLAECVGRDAVVRPVIEQVLVNLPAWALKRVLVTSPERLEVIRLAQVHGCEVVQLCSAGMGDSIAAAVKATAQANGWLILPADLPLISAPTLQTLAQGLQMHQAGCLQVLQPYYQTQKGHPVAFSRAAGPALQHLSGDQGAASVVRQAAEQGALQRVECDDIGCILDVDTVDALGRAREVWRDRQKNL